MKPTFQRVTTARILSAAPDLKYIAFYHADEERLNACMNDYRGRAFVYILSVDHLGSEHFVYVGKSKSQYSRMLNHFKKFAFDHIYLFESSTAQLSENEKAVIKELKPLFNRHCNPLAYRYKTLLGIDYNSYQDATTIHKYLALYEKYNTMGLFGFLLPQTVFSVLQQEAKKANRNCSELLQKLVEEAYPQEVAASLSNEACTCSTNLISAEYYGTLHGKSKEQIKQYLQRERIPGALKVGRDWVLPQDTTFPEDLRKKQRHGV